jgi:hypothetical protein
MTVFYDLSPQFMKADRNKQSLSIEGLLWKNSTNSVRKISPEF